MERKILMTICIIGMISSAVSMIFAAMAKQYTGSIFYLILFSLTRLDFMPRRRKNSSPVERFI